MPILDLGQPTDKDETVEALREAGQETLAVLLDVVDEKEIVGALAEAKTADTTGLLVILVNYHRYLRDTYEGV